MRKIVVQVVLLCVSSSETRRGCSGQGMTIGCGCWYHGVKALGELLPWEGQTGHITIDSPTNRV